MNAPIRFKGFTFNYEAGELVHRDESGRKTVRRLAPQPSKLLLLLLETYPGILSREEIKAAIWPDVQVDFERSLHYCIRQIRAALDDSAADPGFIETIPRRGYRWIAAPEGNETSGIPARRNRFPVGVIAMIGTILVGVLLFLGINGKTTQSTGTEPAPFRVAIMPFQPKDSLSEFSGNDIALQLVESLTNGSVGSIEVIGPTTTADYSATQLRTLIRDLSIDCIINGRFSEADQQFRLLAEIIRADDGAHIWVEYFVAGTDRTVIVETIVNGFLEHFGEEVEALR